MIQVTPHMRVLVAVEPVDFRRGIDGLACHCRKVLGEDPMSGTVFVSGIAAARACAFWSTMGRDSGCATSACPTGSFARGRNRRARPGRCVLINYTCWRVPVTSMPRRCPSPGVR
jgi:hypothetical protein